jgi:hypothetical protein
MLWLFSPVENLLWADQQTLAHFVDTDISTIFAAADSNAHKLGQGGADSIAVRGFG